MKLLVILLVLAGCSTTSREWQATGRDMPNPLCVFFCVVTMTERQEAVDDRFVGPPAPPPTALKKTYKHKGVKGF